MDISKIRKLDEFDTPTVANGIGLLDIRDPTTGFTGPCIRYLTPELGIRVGVAATARFDTTTPSRDEPEWLFSDWLDHIKALAGTDKVGPVPVFAVIECVGLRPEYTVALGDFMATELQLAGAVGVLTNGSIRDLEGIKRVPLACWAGGLVPMHGPMRWLAQNTPVVIDGMTVRPGDIVHADINGAIVIPSEIADQAYDQAMAVREEEKRLFAELLKQQG